MLNQQFLTETTGLDGSFYSETLYQRRDLSEPKSICSGLRMTGTGDDESKIKSFGSNHCVYVCYQIDSNKREKSSFSTPGSFGALKSRGVNTEEILSRGVVYYIFHSQTSSPKGFWKITVPYDTDPERTLLSLMTDLQLLQVLCRCVHVCACVCVHARDLIL